MRSFHIHTRDINDNRLDLDLLIKVESFDCGEGQLNKQYVTIGGIQW